MSLWQAAGSETVPAMRQEYERGKSFTVTVNRCLRALRFTLTNPQRKSTKSRWYARRYKRFTVSAITGPRLLPSSQYFTFQELHRSPNVTGRCSYCSRTIYVTRILYFYVTRILYCNKDLYYVGQAPRKETSRFWAAVNYAGGSPKRITRVRTSHNCLL